MVKFIIVMGVTLYGLCMYNKEDLVWVFMFLPLVYLILKNVLFYVNVSSAQQKSEPTVEVVPEKKPEIDVNEQIRKQVYQQMLQQEQQNRMQQQLTSKPPVNKNISGLSNELSPPLNSNFVAFEGVGTDIDNLSSF